MDDIQLIPSDDAPLPIETAFVLPSTDDVIDLGVPADISLDALQTPFVPYPTDDQPAKRKRGRPRKSEQVQTVVTPQPEPISLDTMLILGALNQIAQLAFGPDVALNAIETTMINTGAQGVVKTVSPEQIQRMGGIINIIFLLGGLLMWAARGYKIVRMQEVKAKESANPPPVPVTVEHEQVNAEQTTPDRASQNGVYSGPPITADDLFNNSIQ